MTIAPGTRLGVYEIRSALGAGGMGEVYRARDMRLERDVAIKLLPELFAYDADRLARFEREAKTLAALNHPNIAAIYGVEEDAGVRALVLELVEGPTLADRIAQGPLPVDEALPIARQICEALEAAHEHGIIHRDLKPANIKLRPDGVVKVLDFGLAKLTQASDLSASPTVTSPAMMTGVGVILGTAAYMAPEQARGKTVDTRADIWAFGCVLFEMLTGSRVFGGEDVTDMLSRVLQREPDWTRLPPDVPPRIRDLLRLCLDKNAKSRRQAAGDVRIDIEQALAEPMAAMPADAPARNTRLAWLAAAVSLAAVLALAIPAVLYFRETPSSDAPEMRVEINTPTTTDRASFALSPDGQQLVFVASGNGPSRLWLRPLAAGSSQPLPGTEGAQFPFWSPDSRSVAFVAGEKLNRLDIIGGQPQALTDAVFRYGTWNADGVILFADTSASPLFRVSASGGEATPVTKLDRQTSHRFPYFLPDGRQFLFYAVGTPETRGIYLGSLDSAETKRLTAADAPGVYLPPGWLLWVRGETLTAQRLDLGLRTLAGAPIRVADSVDSDVNDSAVSISSTGLVAYRSGRVGGRYQLAWFDRSGKALGTVGAPEDRGLRNPRVSPDGRQVAVFRTEQTDQDIWLMDGIRASRFTFANADSGYWPVWSPDGSRIVFDSARKGPRNLYLKPSNGAGSEQLLLESPQNKTPTGWSADGRFLLYVSNDPQTDYDLLVLPMSGGDRKPWVFLKTSFDERNGQFSPDGRWVAYQSNESGQQEIYVRPFAEPVASATAGKPAGGQWQVSTAGGLDPRWRPDGKELYYVGLDGQLMAAPITATGTTLEPGAPVTLFQTRMVFGGRADVGPGQNYDVARDGRFLINTYVDDVVSPIKLLLNWKPPAK